MCGADQIGLRIFVKVAEIERDALVGVIAAPAARNVEQHGIAAAKQALGRTDGLHGDAGADRAGGAVERRRHQAVLTVACKAEHILGRRLIVTGDAHRAVVKHGGADFRTQTGLAQAGAQERRRNSFENLCVDFSGVPHAFQLVGTLDGAQTAQNTVDGGRSERKILLEHGKLLQRHRPRRDVNRFRDMRKGGCNAAEAAKRTDVGKAGVAHGAFIGMAHEKGRLIGRDDERALLHRAGKIIQVDLAVEQNHPPVGVGGGYRAAQVFQTRGELGRRNSGMWHGDPSVFYL